MAQIFPDLGIFYIAKKLTNHGFYSILLPIFGVDKGLDIWYKGDIGDIKVLRFGGLEVWPLRDYGAFL